MSAANLPFEHSSPAEILDAIFKSGRDFFAIWDLQENKVLHASHDLLEKLGYSAAEFPQPSKAAADIVLAEDLPKREAFYDQLRRSAPGEAVEAELRYRAKDGTVQWYNLRGIVIERDPAGKALTSIHQIISVTECRETELKLAREREQVNMLLEFTPVILILREWDSGQILFVNEGSAEILGYSRDEFEQMGSIDTAAQNLLHPKDRESFLKYYRDVVRKPPYEETFRIGRVKHKTKGWRWIQLVHKPIIGVDQDKPTTILTTCLDVTEEQGLTQMLQIASQHLPFAIASINVESSLPERRFGSFATLLGYSDEEFAAIATASGDPEGHLRSVMVAEDFEAYREFRIARRDNPEFSTRELTYQARHKSGRWHFFKMISSVTSRDIHGTPTEILTMIADITDEIELTRALEEERSKLAERAQELSRINAELTRATRLKDEFLANMSHELRTPMSSVLGLAEAIRIGAYGPVSDRQRQALDAIDQSGRHLLALIGDILDLSKLDSGTSELEKSSLDLEALCLESLQFIRQSARENHLHIITKFDINVEHIFADPTRLKQIICQSSF